MVGIGDEGSRHCYYYCYYYCESEMSRVGVLGREPCSRTYRNPRMVKRFSKY